MGNFLLVLLFVLIGGVFAATEMALVSLRESQIARMEQGSKSERTVAELARDSGLFLSAVQIGVTFAGFFSSAFGASTIAPEIAPYFVEWGMTPAVASGVALVVMTLVVSYLSLVLGELVPKRIAMQKAVGFSRVVGPPLKGFATIMRPVIWVMDSSSALILRLLGFDPNVRTEEMSTDEVRDIISSHEGFPEAERELLNDVFAAGERLVTEVMRHRSDMISFEADITVAEVTKAIEKAPYSRYPLFDDSIDNIVGFVHVRDVLAAAARDEHTTLLRAIMRPIAQFPGTTKLPRALSHMRASGNHIAIVVDEYGGTDGMVTLEDLLEELVGEIWDEYDNEESKAVLELHESRTFDASIILEDFADATGITLPDGPYETVAGWILAHLGRLGKEGDVVAIDPAYTADVEDDVPTTSDGAENPTVGYQLKIVETSGNRIVRVTLSKTTLNGELQ